MLLDAKLFQNYPSYAASLSIICRLYEAHRRIQRVNQGLEDKLLRLVDVCETDKTTLTKDVATLSHQLADANYAIKKLTADNVRVR